MLHVAASRAAAGALATRPAAWRPSAAPRPRRRHCRLLLVPAAAASAEPSSESVLETLLAEGGKPRKTALIKLPVAELRAECVRLGMPADGLKADLAERLYSQWVTAVDRRKGAKLGEQAEKAKQQQQHAHQAQQVVVGQPEAAAGAAAVAPAAAAAAPPAATTTSPSAPQRELPAAAPAAPAPVPASESEQGRVCVTWLGTSSGNPTAKRNVSCIAVRVGSEIHMVDAGEGTRNQMRRAKLDPAAVRAIYVTHMHGDHCFGLGGILSAICEARLGTPKQGELIHLYGPPEVQSLVFFALKSGSISLTTPLLATGFVLDPRRAHAPKPVDPAGMLQFALQGPDQGDALPPAVTARLQAEYDGGSEQIVHEGLTWSVASPSAAGLTVQAAQLQHRVPCWGYVFRERDVAAAPPQRQARGGSGGGAPWVRPGRKLVILGDTCDSTAIARLAMGCDLLSHEATFCAGMEDKAAIAQHSTTEQAGAFAAAVGARSLVLTHFSARYESVANIANANKKDRPDSHLRKAEARAEAVAGNALRREVAKLREETLATYGRDSLYLANDFYTFEVAAPAPAPASDLAAEQASQDAQLRRLLAEAATGAARWQMQARPSWQQQQQQQRGGQDQRGGGYQRRDGGGGRGGGRGRGGYQQRSGGSQQRNGSGGRGGGGYQQRDGGEWRSGGGGGYQRRDGVEQRGGGYPQRGDQSWPREPQPQGQVQARRAVLASDDE